MGLDNDHLANNLKGSLESISKGFAILLNSLKTSGFEESIPKYRDLQVLLIQQKLWSENMERKELAYLWREIAEQSRQIYEILSPMTEIMRQLKTIDSLTQNAEKRSLQSSDENLHNSLNAKP